MRDYTSQLSTIMPAALTGRVVRSDGLTLSVAGMPAPVGAVVEIGRHSGEPVLGEVVGFRDSRAVVFLRAELSGVRHGDRVRLVRSCRHVRVGPGLLGRIVDADARPIDRGPTSSPEECRRLDSSPTPAVQRPRIDRPFSTGVRAVDGLLTCGLGQRLGIFSGSGVGKSVLLGMMAAHTKADVNVIALIGERGREVNEFVARDLGPEALARSVVVVATSDEPAVVRVQAAKCATTIAEYFRGRGAHVLLMMDSLTRFALAQREIGLAAGEPPATRGYPPSVFAMLPKLVERAGRGPQGSITAFYSVLVEGDDTNEPVSDCVRGLLDGHVVLSRKLASAGHFPAIDLLQSVSRLAVELMTDEQRRAAELIRGLMAAYRDHEDLLSIGAYQRGSNPTVDTAIRLRDRLSGYLRQDIRESSDVERARDRLIELARAAREEDVPA